MQSRPGRQGRGAGAAEGLRQRRWGGSPGRGSGRSRTTQGCTYLGSDRAPVGYIAWSGVKLAFLGWCKRRAPKISLIGGDLCILAERGHGREHLLQAETACAVLPAVPCPGGRCQFIFSVWGAAWGTGQPQGRELRMKRYRLPLTECLPCCNESQPRRSASDISGDISGFSLLQGNVWHSSNQGLSWEISCLDTQAVTECPSIGLRRGGFPNPPLLPDIPSFSPLLHSRAAFSFPVPRTPVVLFHLQSIPPPFPPSPRQRWIAGNVLLVPQGTQAR